jgi:bifunctional DNA-binding transcriptional regulator/antitoxin component of YhaV-PrlF toxin-antitoxin module
MPAKQSPASPRLLNVATVTLSSEFKVEIPQEMREALGLKPGQRLQAFQFQNRIELIPWMPMHEARGMFPGIDTDIERERS